MTETIHRFWAGSEMPEQYCRYGEAWQVLNPDCAVVDWSMETVQELDLLGQSVLDDLTRRDNGRGTEEYYVQYADLIGYELLRLFGGVYVNCDIEPVRSLGRLGAVDSNWCQKNWATYENLTDGRIVNAAIGAPTDHQPFWINVIQRAIVAYASNPQAEMVETTGPAMLTVATNEWNESNDDKVAVFPVDTFNPVHWSLIEQGGDASAYTARGNFPDATVGVHHWSHRKSGRTNTIPA